MAKAMEKEKDPEVMKAIKMKQATQAIKDVNATERLRKSRAKKATESDPLGLTFDKRMKEAKEAKEAMKAEKKSMMAEKKSMMAEKPKRKSRFVKGSQEAKDYMASIRKMKK
jgi:hypothetical protein